MEGSSKSVNLGNLLRTAHAFGASFVFTIGADPRALDSRGDTSKAPGHLPVYHWPSPEALALPKGCSLVGVELLDAATELPVFAHPLRAAYILGPERGILSPGMLSRCDHLIRIPTSFSLNLATAGAVVMYDRLRTSGRYGTRPLAEGASALPPLPHVQGAPRRRRREV